ncbi:MAG: T9SS type A sorting domain-containing protein, partial [Bacteroidota bacterium]
TKINSLDRVTSITFNPLNTNMIYMTTEQNGLWYSMNIHNVTPTFSQVSNYKFRQPERVFFNPYNPGEVWISSFGNGMKMGNLCGNFSGQITAAGPTTFCIPGSVTLNASSAAGLIYQWYKKNILVPGATSSSYVATQSGSHKCIVTNASGCAKTSNKILITAQNCLRSIGDNAHRTGFIIYPNPATDVIKIESEFLPEKILVTNTLGQKLIEIKSTNSVDVSKLIPGIYLMKIFDKNNNQAAVKLFIKE